LLTRLKGQKKVTTDRNRREKDIRKEERESGREGGIGTNEWKDG